VKIFPDRVRELGERSDCPVAYRTIKPEKAWKTSFSLLKSGAAYQLPLLRAATSPNFAFQKSMGGEALDFLKDVTIAAIGPVEQLKAIEERAESEVCPEQ